MRASGLGSLVTQIFQPHQAGNNHRWPQKIAALESKLSGHASAAQAVADGGDPAQARVCALPAARAGLASAGHSLRDVQQSCTQPRCAAPVGSLQPLVKFELFVLVCDTSTVEIGHSSS